MQRRSFIRAGIAAALAAPLAPSTFAEAAAPRPSPPFALKFGPHHGHFKQLAGDDILDQIRFAHDQGFTAWEDNGMPGRPPELQSKIGNLLAQLGMTMGVFVAYADFKHCAFAGHRLDIDNRHRDPQAVKQMLQDRMRNAVEIAKRVNAKWCTVVPGTVDPSVTPEYQTANAVEMLRYCADICEPSGLVIVLEPLNHIDHPGCLLQRIPHAHQVCKMVASPSVKILDDLYHQQISEGNLITNMIEAWDEIAYIQVGDVPGRKEPTSGEINYAHIFRWLRDRGYDGVVGMEHGISLGGPAGERHLIQSYRTVNPA